nr:MAG TPA: hypothetical protein [Caudoviricetes sp.]
MGLNLNTIYNTPRDIRTSMRLTGTDKGSFSLNLIDEAANIYKETVKESFYDFSVLALNESFDPKSILSNIVKLFKNIINALIKFIKTIADIIRKAISSLINTLNKFWQHIKNADTIKDKNLSELEKILKDKQIRVNICDIDNIVNLISNPESIGAPVTFEMIAYDIDKLNNNIKSISYSSDLYSEMWTNGSEYKFKQTVDEAINNCNSIGANRIKDVCNMAISELFVGYSGKEVSNGILYNSSRFGDYIENLNNTVFGNRNIETVNLDIDLYTRCKDIVFSINPGYINDFVNSLKTANNGTTQILNKCNELISNITTAERSVSSMPAIQMTNDSDMRNMFGIITNTFKVYTSFITDVLLSHQKVLVYRMERISDVYGPHGYCMKIVDICNSLEKNATINKESSINIDGKTFDNILENRFNENIEKLFNIAESEYIDRKFGVLFESILLEDGEKKTGVLGIFEAIKAFFGKVAEIFKKLFTGENSAVEKAVHGTAEDVAAGKDRTKIFNAMKDKVQYNDEVAKITTTDTVFYDQAKIDAFEQKLGTLDIDNVFPANTAELFGSNYLGKFSKDIYTAMNETGGETKLIIKYLKDMGINVNDNDEKINITQVLLDNFTSHSTGNAPENIKKDDLDSIRDNFDKFMNNGSVIKNLEQKVVTTLEKISNTDYSNFDVNSLDQNTIETLKQVFGDDENTTAQGEAMSFKSYSALQNILEAIQTNGAGGENSSGNNNSGNLKLVTKYLNALKSMAKAKIKIIQAYVSAKTKIANDSYNIFDTIAKAVFTDDYNAAVGSGNNTNAPKPNNPNDAQQNQNNNEKK